MGGDEEVTRQHVPMSPGRRTALFTLASLHVILCSGTAYGWTAIRIVFKNAGVFASSSELDQSRKVSKRKKGKDATDAHTYARVERNARGVKQNVARDERGLSPPRCWRARFFHPSGGRASVELASISSPTHTRDKTAHFCQNKVCRRLFRNFKGRHDDKKKRTFFPSPFSP